jgi:hypothetical protein
MNYEDEVIEAARKGLAEGFTHLTPEMEKLMRLIYQAGYKQSTIDRMQKELKPDLSYSRVGLGNV